MPSPFHMSQSTSPQRAAYPLRPRRKRRFTILLFQCMGIVWFTYLLVTYCILHSKVVQRESPTSSEFIKKESKNQVRPPRSTIPLGQRRPYSSHFCIEPNDMHPIYRSCHFTDVCFARTLDGKTFSIQYEDESNTTLPGKMIYISSNDQNLDPNEIETCIQRQKLIEGPNIYYPLEDFFLKPVVVDSATLAPFKKVWSPIPLAIPYQQMNAKNFGHSLGDNVFSFYRIMKLFNIYTDDIDFVPLLMVMNQLQGYKGYYGNYYTGLFTTLEPFVYNRGLSYMKDEKDVLDYGNFLNYFDRFIQEDAETTLLCFENVLSGLYFLSDHGEDPNFHSAKDWLGPNNFHVGRGDDIFEFRRAYMHRLGVDENVDLDYHTCRQLLHDTEPMADSIVILPRSAGSRGFWWDERRLISKLNLPKHVVREMSYSLSMREQVEIVAKAKVVVSMVGGASYISWFLPPGATLILLSRREVHGKLQVNDAHIYDNIPYFRTRYFKYAKVVNATGEHLYRWGSIQEEIRAAMQRYDETRIAYDCDKKS